MTTASTEVVVAHATLLVRPAVAWREQALPTGQGLYLSLYDDEIEQRANDFWEQLRQCGLNWSQAPLEPSDAVMFARGNEVVLARGAAATFPLYWRTDGRRLGLTTALPVLDDEPLSASGLLAAVAAAALNGSYEPNAFVQTPLARWRRVRRASWLRFSEGLCNGQGIISPTWQPRHSSRDAVARSVRSAIDAYGRSQSQVTQSLLEVSGGFDSTLAAAAVNRERMHGVSVVFPFYEFRFEEPVQRATAEFLGIDRTGIDGLDLFPYAPTQSPIRFDEPSVFITGMRHAETVARFGFAKGLRRLYTGHGGDQCFSTNLFVPEVTVDRPPQRGPFSGRAWGVVSKALASVRSSPWNDRRLGTFVYDARADAWTKETFGLTPRTPFSDRALFESALDWSCWCQQYGVCPDKSILAEGAADLLPEAVLTRRGKVAYDGVWMRAYCRNARHIDDVFSLTADTLEHIGIDTRWVRRRSAELADWQARSDREILALYAVATWVEAWGLCRPGERTWVD